jgi:small subunit ribosomal protein S20
LAHHASALKAMRQSVKRRARNRQNMSRLRTQIKKFRALVAKGDAKVTATLLPETDSEIDKAAKKGTIHFRAASRYKSRLAKRLNAATRKA